jgi:hypothetical protein
LARCPHFVISDEQGNIIDGATVTVRREIPGQPLVVVYSDRDGTVSLGSTFVAADGADPGFYAVGGSYMITATLGALTRIWRHVAIGLAAESDFGAVPQVTVDNTVPRFDGMEGRVQTSGVLIDDSNNVAPVTSGVGALGTALLMWAGLFLATGSTINFNNGDVVATHSANTLTWSGASSGYAFDALVRPTTNDAAALGSGTVSWADLFLASGGVINFANGNASITHISSGIIRLDASNSVAVNGPVLRPNADDGSALGAGAAAWSDLFLATGAVINFGNGDVTVTHSANVLTFSGADNGYRFSNTIFPASSDGAALGNGTLMWSDMFLADGGVINWNNGGATITHVVASDVMTFAGAAGGYLFSHIAAPQANDGAALGNGANAWSDLFLANGGVINFNNGDVTMTHSVNGLSFAGGNYTFIGNVSISSSYLEMDEIASPANPAVNGLRIFVKDVFGVSHLFTRDSAGTEVDVSTGGSGGAAAATQPEMEAATSTAVFSSPGRQHFHPSAAKAWVHFNSAATIGNSYNITSVTDVGTGQWNVTIANDFSGAQQAGVATTGHHNVNGALAISCIGITAGNYALVANDGGAPTVRDPNNPDIIMWVSFGDMP